MSSPRRKEKGSNETNDSGYYSNGISYYLGLVCPANKTVVSQSAFLSSQNLTIEAWSSSRDHYRVVAFGYPKTMPLQKHRIPDGQEIPWTEEVKQCIQECLRKFRIQWTRISADRISSKVVLNTADEPMDTVVIESVNEDPSSFKQAATEIAGILTAAGRPEFSFQVEIRNPKLMAANSSRPLPDDRLLLRALEDAQQSILQRVKLYCGQTWTSIAFHMRGNRLQPDDLCKPTVVVFCKPGSTCDFEALELALRVLLDPIGWTTDIRPGFLSWCIQPTIQLSLPLIYRSDLPLKPEHGSSIGVRGNTTQAGSVGCWLTLKLADGTELPVLLTCYHVVVSEDKVVKDKIDQEGMHYGDTTRKVVVQYPAAFDLDANVKDVEDKATYDKLKHLSLTSEIGYVIAASGVRVNSRGRRMDWALILSPDTYRKNTLPSNATLTNRAAYPVGGLTAYKVAEGEEVRGFSQMKADAWLVKKGRTSGVTSGWVSKLDRLVQWESIKTVSYEHEVTGLVEDFADPGDSGSMVTDEHGGLAGILIGKDLCSNDLDPGFVTPFHEIHEDVMLYTNGGTLSLP
ncbi:MAG: hypothetical protein LQ347_004953 [Umbilicaria vellea]|nr:MAG: hypothetical protein LQ347_004953 [Umbilicaria vellea]